MTMASHKKKRDEVDHFKVWFQTRIPLAAFEEETPLLNKHMIT
jgi:hypothetical protein